VFVRHEAQTCSSRSPGEFRDPTFSTKSARTGHFTKKIFGIAIGLRQTAKGHALNDGIGT
jgi:hypothetical protein